MNAKVFVAYDATNLDSGDNLSIERIKRYSFRHDSNYYVLLLDTDEKESWTTRTVLEKKDKELFDFIDAEIKKESFIKSTLKLTRNAYNPDKLDGFLETNMVCDFEAGISDPWITNLRVV